MALAKTRKAKIKKATPNNELVRFDWAMKRLLRNKANFAVLEGFLSVLLKETVKIIKITDAEGNKAKEALKFNRVDILVENDRKELIIIELQNCSEVDYFFRMLFGVSKAITDHLEMGDRYVEVRKVYHINIVYFELGQGVDYVYHGSTEFRGIHRNDVLKLNAKQKELFSKETVSELYPEYYILRVEDFDDAAKDSLDEWIYFLKNNAIPEEFTAPGLPEARKALRYYKLSDEERRNYDFHVDQARYEQNVINDSIEKGLTEGRAVGLAEGKAVGLAEGLTKGLTKGLAKGLAKGKAEERVLVVINSHKAGLSVETIAMITDLAPEQITAILKKQGLTE
ncbi:MAG: Rpn family recombination-promoting nuclease/putative transposase [Bacteroidales bacterium]|jgi:predicted transposase/invertase (TIGR01784 family)|nr:Rpn family recombination-promoting nuclease/putative transposase [Bacteroidales bacterium]